MRATGAVNTIVFKGPYSFEVKDFEAPSALMTAFSRPFQTLI
jgi:hypothetical protein